MTAYQAGVLVEWDPATFSNRVDLAGQVFVDVPIFGTPDLDTGDRVAVVERDAEQALIIVGRLR